MQLVSLTLIRWIVIYPMDMAPTFEQLGPEIHFIPRFWRETNSFFILSCLFVVVVVVFFFSLELPHTTTTKVPPASKYPMKIKVVQ